MENRDRDNMKQDDETTDAGEITQRKKPDTDSDADFGQNTARSETLDKEPPRRQAGYLGDGKSDVGRTGSKNNSDH